LFRWGWFGWSLGARNLMNYKQNSEKLIDSDLRPYRLNGISDVDLLDEILLYNSESKMGFSLNNSAKTIWQLCDGKRRVIDITQEVAQLFGITLDQLVFNELLSDIVSTIFQLQDLGILGLREESSTNVNLEILDLKA
jgi:hypothetical protein